MTNEDLTKNAPIKGLTTQNFILNVLILVHSILKTSVKSQIQNSLRFKFSLVDLFVCNIIRLAPAKCDTLQILRPAMKTSIHKLKATGQKVLRNHVIIEICSNRNRNTLHSALTGLNLVHEIPIFIFGLKLNY